MMNNSLITDNGKGIFQFSRYVLSFKSYVLKTLKEKARREVNNIITNMHSKEFHNSFSSLNIIWAIRSKGMR
jgi:hypothetical protein